MKQYSVFLTNNKVIEWSNSRLLVVVSRAPVSENTRFALFTGRLAERVEEGETSLSELWSISTNDLSIKKKNRCGNLSPWKQIAKQINGATSDNALGTVNLAFDSQRIILIDEGQAIVPRRWFPPTCFFYAYIRCRSSGKWRTRVPPAKPICPQEKGKKKEK